MLAYLLFCFVSVLQRWLVFNPPHVPQSGHKLLSIEREHVAITCGILPCSDVAVWLPSSIPVADVDVSVALAVFVATVYRVRDSSTGTLIIGPGLLLSLPGVASGIGLSEALGSRDGDGSIVNGSITAAALLAASDAMFALSHSPLTLFNLLQPYMHLIRKEPLEFTCSY